VSTREVQRQRPRGEALAHGHRGRADGNRWTSMVAHRQRLDTLDAVAARCLFASCGCRTGATAGPAASASGAAGRRHGDGGRADGRCGAAHRSGACGRRCRHVGVAGRAGRAAAQTQALASPRRPPCLRSTPSTLREARRLLLENRKRVLQFSYAT
jgi:hypothetical protein